MENAIVGREGELALADGFLDRLPTGPSALVIVGEAGIGKTTLWLETVREAKSRSFRVLEARPAGSEVKLSYAALADLVGSGFDETRSSLPRVQERAMAAALLRAETDEPAPARTTATALVGVLTALAEQGPLLLAIDDVQWLDPASEEALAFAVRRLPPQLGLLVARRSDPSDELPLDLGRALPPDRVELLVPAPLTLAGLHHLIKSNLETSLPRPLLVRLAEASGGNPFFALEIGRVLAQRADEYTGGEPLPVPRRLEELVGARVDDLSASARHVVLAAAAIPSPTPSNLALALPAEDTGAALLEAEEAGVLIGERGRIRFAHPLLASAIYGAASDERRRQLHGHLAAVVSDPEERAHHLALGATEPDEEVAAELEQVAERAAMRGAPDAAAQLLGASARLTPETHPDELARRRLAQAAAALAAGDVGGARVLAEDAAASKVASIRAQGEYLLGEILWVGGTWGPATDHLQAALEAAPDDESLAARIYPKLVNFTVAHDPARGVEHAKAALRSLDPEHAPGAVASVVFDRFWAGLLLGQSDQPELLERWRELEAKAGSEAPKSVIPLIHLHSVDDFEAARARHALEDEWYRLRGDDGWRAERQAHRSFVEFRAGDWDEAERLVEESCAVVAQHERPGPWTMAFRFRAIVDAGRGRTERARATLLPLIDDAERSGRAWWKALMLSSLGFVEFAAGDHRAVEQTLTRLRETLETIGTRDMVPDRSEPFHIESLLVLGEHERARNVLARLEERGRIYPRLWITATLPRARALVLAAEGDVETALDELAALDIDAASTLPFDLAWTLLVQGRLQRRIKRKRLAADSLARALTIFEQLGAPAWIEQTRTELRRVGLRRAPEGLTPTERRVAELAASGLTNREVASAAFMSPKTVQANLTRVYRKLGIRSRAELGARMSQQTQDGSAQT